MTWSKVHSSFWTGTTADSLGHDVDALHLAHYLVTGPMATNTGLYQFTVSIACRHTGLSRERLGVAMRKLVDCGFTLWDADNEVVFVRNAVKWQVLGSDTSTIAKGDKRIPAMVRCVEKFCWHPFSGELAFALRQLGVANSRVHAIEGKHLSDAPSASDTSEAPEPEIVSNVSGRGMQEKETNSCQDLGRGMQKLPRLEREREREKEFNSARTRDQPAPMLVSTPVAPIPATWQAQESTTLAADDQAPILAPSTIPGANERPKHVRLEQAPFLKQAYSDGIFQATGWKYAVPRHEMGVLDDAVDAFAPSISGGHIAWLLATAKSFALDVGADVAWKTYKGGISPKGFLAWLNEGRHERVPERPKERPKPLPKEEPRLTLEEISEGLERALREAENV